MVYSYAGNAPKEDKFPRVFFDESGNAVGSEREDGPGETLTFEQAKERNLKQAVKPEEGVAWWERKNSRVSGRAANAAEKAAKAASSKNSTTASSEPVTENVDEDEVVEKFDGDTAQGVETVEAQ
jgi:hypothetical protein